jgi:hypothetical protein
VKLNVGERKQNLEKLLQPLKPPTDPSIAQEGEERRMAAIRQNQAILKRWEDEQRARVEILEKYQRDSKTERQTGKRPIQTFVTMSEDVPVKVDGQGEKLEDVGVMASEIAQQLA